MDADNSNSYSKRNQIMKKIGLVTLASCFTWEYITTALEKHRQTHISHKPSYILTKSGEYAKIFFFTIGEYFGVVYDKVIFYTKYLNEFLRHVFDNLFHYIRVFADDLVETGINVLKPTFELVKSPFNIVTGFYDKLSKLSPVNLKYASLALVSSGVFVFGLEYLTLLYENNRKLSDESYVFKYKPSNMLGYVSTGAQIRFTKAGQSLGNTVVSSYNFVKNLGTYIEQYVVSFGNWLRKTFSNLYETSSRLMSPMTRILTSPFNFVGGYSETIKSVQMNKYYPIAFMFALLSGGVYLLNRMYLQ
jgi:hypothetical protein